MESRPRKALADLEMSTRKSEKFDSIGARIKHIRKPHGLNQVSFAESLGISQGTLSELEKNKFRQSVGTILQLHQKFDVDINWLLLSVKG
jgi:transcriptional regulator with XRE-family HTH domain